MLVAWHNWTAPWGVTAEAGGSRVGAASESTMAAGDVITRAVRSCRDSRRTRLVREKEATQA